MTEQWLWGGFVVLVLAILAIDLGVVSRRSREVSPGRALAFTGVFVGLALAFAGVVYAAYERGWMAGALSHKGEPMTGGVAVAEYLSVWLLEYSLSVDNLFVFALVFAHFGVPAALQHRVLFWGIIGALVLRGVMIGVGAAVVHAWAPVLYLFGVLLLWTAWKLLTSKEEDGFDPGRSLAVRLLRRVLPVTDGYRGERFVVREPLAAPAGGTASGRAALHATPLLLVLLVIEAADVMFAIDSIPAAFGNTREPFIIFTANVFAIMGLRSLFFALSGLMKMFVYLKVSLALVLAFVGVKLILERDNSFVGLPAIHLGSAVSLGFIALCLTGGVVASLLVRGTPADPGGAAPPAGPADPT